MMIRRYAGTRTATFGFRFLYRGRQYQRKGFPNRSLAKEAERRERQRVQQTAFELRWGPLTPKLTTWEEAVAAYVRAKTDKRFSAISSSSPSVVGNSWIAIPSSPLTGRRPRRTTRGSPPVSIGSVS
jgi:hypothetical protein